MTHQWVTITAIPMASYSVSLYKQMFEGLIGKKHILHSVVPSLSTYKALCTYHFIYRRVGLATCTVTESFGLIGESLVLIVSCDVRGSFLK